jgi:predicted dienelactone hydrolase
MHPFYRDGDGEQARSPIREPVRPLAKFGFRGLPRHAQQRRITTEIAMSLRLIPIVLTLVALFLTPPVAIAAPAADAPSAQAAFERQTTGDGMEVGIWYPASGKPSWQRLGLFAQDVVADSTVPSERHPLIVISHGTGGDFSGHVDTAVALARAGFIVAALTHPGDNWRDNSRATRIEERPVALSNLISYMLTAWPGHAAIDADRVGAFGFSSGGFTVLAAAGGRPDLTRLADHCAQHPTFFVCTLLKSQPRAMTGAWPAIRDPRIKAVVAAAPALGFAFDRAGLAEVRVPVQLWRADDDQILPAPFYADVVRAALPTDPEFHTVPGAGHFDFLAPCADMTAMPQLCRSAPGFDRVAFHAQFDAEVVRFFAARLGRSPLKSR